MSSACSRAWTDEGSAPILLGIPWRAIRNLVLHYKGAAKAVLQLTLNGASYDISKQATEGMVIVGNGYSGVSFILPDDREQVTGEEAAGMSLYDYLVKLGDTEYGEVPAWDYFAAFVSETMDSLLNNADSESDIDVTQLRYGIYNMGGNWGSSFFGVADFTTVNTARAFFHALYSGLEDPESAKTVSLTPFLESNKSIYMLLELGPEAGTGAENVLQFPMHIGVK